MACFIVSAAEAVVTTIAARAIEKKEIAQEADQSSNSIIADTEVRIPFSRKLKWLRNMLWGGSALLAFEHIWHGEIVPWFPFLTAAADPASTTEMLNEMATVGVSMAALITLVWAGMVGVTSLIGKRAPKTSVAEG